MGIFVKIFIKNFCTRIRLASIKFLTFMGKVCAATFFHIPENRNLCHWWEIWRVYRQN